MGPDSMIHGSRDVFIREGAKPSAPAIVEAPDSLTECQAAFLEQVVKG